MRGIQNGARCRLRPEPSITITAIVAPTSVASLSPIRIATPPVPLPALLFSSMTELEHLSMTQDAYDIVAASYTELLRDELDGKPLDRGLLATFADMMLAGGGSRVLDAGCGPGRIAAYLSELGLNVFGIDLSPNMIESARAEHPQLQFDVGSMLEVDLPADSVDGIVGWYSIIHTPPEQLPGIFDELGRVLVDKGLLLLAFQIGDERVRLEHVYGHAASYDVYRLSPEKITAQLSNAGFRVEVSVVREATEAERQSQAYLLARKRSADQALPAN